MTHRSYDLMNKDHLYALCNLLLPKSPSESSHAQHGGKKKQTQNASMCENSGDDKYILITVYHIVLRDKENQKYIIFCILL